MGAPLGLLLLRAGSSGALPGVGFIQGQLAADPALYLYMALATSAVMGFAGYHMGCYQERLAALSDRDALTGLFNRRGFDARLQQEVARASRAAAQLCLLLIDVDRFKDVNDRFGHAVGDLALRQVASVMKTTSRRADVVARPGGDEFAMILPDASADEGVVVAERLAERLRAQTPVAEGASAITLSIGAAELTREDDSYGETLTRRADAALYQAKQNGRDRVVSSR